MPGFQSSMNSWHSRFALKKESRTELLYMQILIRMYFQHYSHITADRNCGEIFLTFYSVAHGPASLLANNSMEYDEAGSTKMLENVFFGMAASKKGR